MDLLEREADLAVLEGALADAGRSAGSVVFVSGEAGIGKTRLVRSFAQNHKGDARVLWGACDDLSTPRTLGPFRDIAPQVDGALKATVVDGTRGEVFDAVLDAIAVRNRATAVIVEDVHWADGATLDVLKFLGRRIDRIPATLVLTYRDEEVPDDHPLMLVIGDLPASAVHRINLAPLSRAAVEVAAAGYAGSVDDLYAKSRGNPFLVTEALVAAPVAVRRDPVAHRLAPRRRVTAESSMPRWEPCPHTLPWSMRPYRW